MNTIQSELTSILTTGPRAISERSANIYIKNLNTIANKATGEDYKSNAFLQDYAKIEKIISFEYSQATTKNFLNAILAALSPEGKWKYIEGFEIDLINHLLDKNALDHVSKVYVETHERKFTQLTASTEKLKIRIKAEGYENKFFYDWH